MEEYILSGWKGMASYVHVHPQTLKNWHYKKKKIPFQKTSCDKAGRLFITIKKFQEWLDEVIGIMPRRTESKCVATNMLR